MIAGLILLALMVLLILLVPWVADTLLVRIILTGGRYNTKATVLMWLVALSIAACGIGAFLFLTGIW